MTDILPTDISFGTKAADAEAFRTEYGDSYEFDLSAGEFVRPAPGDPVNILSGPASLAQALEKALLTRRYADLAYDGSYGSEAWAYLDGAPPAGSARDTLLNHYATEALRADPRVARVDGMRATVPAPGTLRVVADVTDTFSAVTHLDVTLTG